jgi:hypothetical protein
VPGSLKKYGEGYLLWIAPPTSNYFEKSRKTVLKVTKLLNIVLEFWKCSK